MAAYQQGIQPPGLIYNPSRLGGWQQICQWTVEGRPTCVFLVRPEASGLSEAAGDIILGKTVTRIGEDLIGGPHFHQVAEMEQFNKAMEALGISPETVHRAFDRYFAETMPDV